jgi:anti-sigma28 factor (negative regulator of flagellin synthesis)
MEEKKKDEKETDKVSRKDLVEELKKLLDKGTYSVVTGVFDSPKSE